MILSLVVQKKCLSLELKKNKTITNFIKNVEFVTNPSVSSFSVRHKRIYPTVRRSRTSSKDEKPNLIQEKINEYSHFPESLCIRFKLEGKYTSKM